MNLIVFFTFGYSLKDWSDRNHITREAKLYNRLAEHGIYTTFITFGNSKDHYYKNYFSNKIKIIPIYDKIKIPDYKIFYYLFSLIIPIIFYREIKKGDVLKTNQIWGGWVAVISKYLFNKPLLVRAGYEAYSFSKNNDKGIHHYLLKYCSLLTYRNANKILLTTNGAKNFVSRNFNVNDKKIIVKNNWIDTGNFSPQKVRKTKRLLFVGRFSKQKNIDLFLRSLSGTDIEVDFVGKGRLKKKLIEQSNELNVKANFLGIFPNEQMPQIYNRYSIYILCSLYEGNPKTLLEAMACGLAVIGTNVSGINNIIEDNKNGLLVDLDRNSIISGILNLLNNKEKRELLGRRAREYVIENCSIETYLDIEKTIYNDLNKNNQ